MTAASVARMSKAISGLYLSISNPAYRYAHAGYGLLSRTFMPSTMA